MKINMKKLGVLVMAALVAGSAFAGPSADAAKGGAKLGGGAKVSAPAPKPAASTAAPKSNATTESAKKDSPNNKEYAPSKKADEHSNTAPAAKNNTNNANAANPANTANSGSRWGSALRTMGLLAGGMMLGSLLSSMFGFGMGGLLADILGVVANIAILMVVIMAIKWAWNKFRGNKSQNDYARPSQETIDVQPQYSSPIQDIKPPTGSPIQDIKPMGASSVNAMGSTSTNSDLNGVTGYDYSADRTADRYRKL